MTTLSLDEANQRYSADALCTHIAHRIDDTPVQAQPFAHFVVDDALPPDFYRAFAAAIPEPEEFEPVTPGTDAASDHTTVLSYRRFADQSPDHKVAFDKVRQAFQAASRHIHAKLEPAIENAFEEIFGDDAAACLQMADVEHVPVANLYERRPWFEQPPHLDGCFRLATWLYYLPLSLDLPIRGTDIFRTVGRSTQFDPIASMYLRSPRGLDLEAAGSVEFRENRILAFANSPFSYHGVSPEPPETGNRGRRITMLNWIEMSKPATERIYARALFGNAVSPVSRGSTRFEAHAEMPLGALELAADTVRNSDGSIRTRPQCWSYAAWLPLGTDMPPAPDDATIRVTLQVAEGAVGVGLQSVERSDFICEYTVASGPAEVTLDLGHPARIFPLRLMVRNVCETGPSQFTLTRIVAGSAS